MRKPVMLVAMTGDRRSDTVLRAVVGAFLRAFPERVRGCFVDGSGADGTLRVTSDLDVTLVFKGRFNGSAEQKRADALSQQLAGESAIELDIEACDEADLARGCLPSIQDRQYLCLGRGHSPKCAAPSH